MDNDDIEYLGTNSRGILKGISLVPTSTDYLSQSFTVSDSHDSLAIEVGRMPKASPSPFAKASRESALYRCAVVSRKHARITISRSQVTVQDLSSHHGSVLDPHFGTSVAVPSAFPTAVHDGDILTFGKPVSDFHGGHVDPVSVTIKFIYSSSNRFGLSCLSESESDSDEHSRGSSMDISIHSSPRQSPAPPLSGPSSLLRSLLPTNPHSIPRSKRNESPSPEASSFEGVREFSFPPNQLGLEPELPSRMSHFDYLSPGPSSHSLAPLSSAQSSSSSSFRSPSPPGEFPGPLLDSVFTSPSFDSQNRDELENHAAILSLEKQLFSVPREDVVDLDAVSNAWPSDDEQDRIVSSTPLDSQPVTPIRQSPSCHDLRGPEQSPVTPVADSNDVTMVEPVEEKIPDSSSPIVEERGIRAFFKAIGVVRTLSSDSSASSPGSSGMDNKEELMAELRAFVTQAVRDQFASSADSTLEVCCPFVDTERPL